MPLIFGKAYTTRLWFINWCWISQKYQPSSFLNLFSSCLLSIFSLFLLRLLAIHVVLYLRRIMSSRWAPGPQSSESVSPAGESSAFCISTKLTSEDSRHLQKFLTFPYWENPLTSSYIHIHTHIHVWFWGLSIDVMGFRLYKLYILSPSLNLANIGNILHFYIYNTKMCKCVKNTFLHLLHKKL